MTKMDLPARLIAEAMRLLAENPQDLTLRAVARGAGVSAMAPYRHFADKAALLDAVTKEGFALLRAAVTEADAAAPDDTEAIIAQGLAYLAFARRHPALFRLMFTSPLERRFDPAQLAGETAYSVLARRVAGFAPQVAAAATTAAWSLVHGLALLRLDHRLPEDEGEARAMLRLFVSGLRVAAAH
ncbi:TetR/AcrR family transcriptional regulator [Acidisoma sp. C75]